MKKRIVIKEGENTCKMVSVDDIKSLAFHKRNYQNRLETCEMLINAGAAVQANCSISDRGNDALRDTMRHEFEELQDVLEDYVFGGRSYDGKEYLIRNRMVIEMGEKTKQITPNVAMVRVVTETNSDIITRPHNPLLECVASDTVDTWDVKIDYGIYIDDKTVINKAINIVRQEYGVEELTITDAYVNKLIPGETETSYIRWRFEL